MKTLQNNSTLSNRDVKEEHMDIKDYTKEELLKMVDFYNKRKAYQIERNKRPDVIAKRKAYQTTRNSRIKKGLALLEELENRK